MCLQVLGILRQEEKHFWKGRNNGLHHVSITQCPGVVDPLNMKGSVAMAIFDTSFYNTGKGKVKGSPC